MSNGVYVGTRHDCEQMNYEKFDRVLLVAAGVVFLVLANAGCGRSAAELNNQGNEAFDNQDYHTSLESYQQAHWESPELAEPVYNSGNSYYRQQGFDEAQESYENALAIADKTLTQNIMFNLGNALFSALRFDEAIEAYKQALRIDPDDMDAKHNLELVLREQQDQDEAKSQEKQPQAQPGQGQREEQAEVRQGEQPADADDQFAGGQQSQEEHGRSRRDRPQTVELTEEQARQLLEAVGQGTDTLQGHLLRSEQVTDRPLDRDW